MIGAMKAGDFEDVAGFFAVLLSREEIEYFEKLYVSHKIVGAL